MLNKGDVVIDVGANIVYYTLMMAQRVGPTGRVYAFEPDPTNRAILTKNVQENHLDNVIISASAIGKTAGPAQLYLSEENYGDHRLFADSDENTQRKQLPIQTDTLDHVFMVELPQQRINLIKSDTQGFEPYVIQGAENVLQQHKPTLFFEYWPYGYRHSRADENHMNDFLRRIYGEIFIVDDSKRQFYAVDEAHIKEFCTQFNNTMHCNLMCSAQSAATMQHQVATASSDLLNALRVVVGIEVVTGV